MLIETLEIDKRHLASLFPIIFQQVVNCISYLLNMIEVNLIDFSFSIKMSTPFKMATSSSEGIRKKSSFFCCSCYTIT